MTCFLDQQVTFCWRHETSLISSTSLLRHYEARFKFLIVLVNYRLITIDGERSLLFALFRGKMFLVRADFFRGLLTEIS